MRPDLLVSAKVCLAMHGQHWKFPAKLLISVVVLLMDTKAFVSKTCCLCPYPFAKTPTFVLELRNKPRVMFELFYK